jgi:hypothetical protein
MKDFFALFSYDDAPTLKHKAYNLQLISFKYHTTVEELLNKFDFTVCQFAYDGSKLYMGSKSLGDLMFNRLNFNCTENKYSIYWKRWNKYNSAGFKPTPEAIKTFSEIRIG